MLQRVLCSARSCLETLRLAGLQHSSPIRGSIIRGTSVFSRLGRVTSSPPVHHKGLENTTVSDVLLTKGDEETGSSSWLWCRANDTVRDAAKHMAEYNVGSLVVLKPGNEKLIAGIVTERDYLRKVVACEKAPESMKVGEIMTGEKMLITVTSDTNILQAMQLMTENSIRHVPVVDGKIIGMISIVDVVRAVVEQQSHEMKQLNQFIKGDYY